MRMKVKQEILQSSMRMKGFEPLQALSYESLNLARLTTPAHPHKNLIKL